MNTAKTIKNHMLIYTFKEYFTQKTEFSYVVPSPYDFSCFHWAYRMIYTKKFWVSKNYLMFMKDISYAH